MHDVKGVHPDIVLMRDGSPIALVEAKRFSRRAFAETLKRLRAAADAVDSHGPTSPCADEHESRFTRLYFLPVLVPPVEELPLVFVDAPTGEGKTEAGLAAALYLRHGAAVAQFGSGPAAAVAQHVWNAAMQARQSILTSSNPAEIPGIATTFAQEWLGRELHSPFEIEATVDVLLDDDWQMAVSPDDNGAVCAELTRQVKRRHALWRPETERQLGLRGVVSLDTSLANPRPDHATLADTVACPTRAEELVLAHSQEFDSRITRVLDGLSPAEHVVALTYAHNPDLTWAQALQSAHDAAPFGPDRVPRKLRRLGQRFVARQQGRR
ncbi:hypothetical protein [Saccharopolyspora phatthalungensis]|uniref:Uncharacterized protein n=1 Tax=Saccharopolyspora phatthalungensis TaxID=664693 RepID=A0A840Q614_9PSEU|nr:hypothetical protein [Saccharopolyspora phatthalungensis]MBB5155906.1 hypothetical protein [Saccharopolyspora phatthalungensis]